MAGFEASISKKSSFFTGNPLLEKIVAIQQRNCRMNNFTTLLIILLSFQLSSLAYSSECNSLTMDINNLIKVEVTNKPMCLDPQRQFSFTIDDMNSKEKIINFFRKEMKESQLEYKGYVLVRFIFCSKNKEYTILDIYKVNDNIYINNGKNFYLYDKNNIIDLFNELSPKELKDNVINCLK